MKLLIEYYCATKNKSDVSRLPQKVLIYPLLLHFIMAHTNTSIERLLWIMSIEKYVRTIWKRYVIWRVRYVIWGLHYALWVRYNNISM